jgi:hypothetical protein
MASVVSPIDVVASIKSIMKSSYTNLATNVNDFIEETITQVIEGECLKYTTIINDLKQELKKSLDDKIVDEKSFNKVSIVKKMDKELSLLKTENNELKLKCFTLENKCKMLEQGQQLVSIIGHEPTNIIDHIVIDEDIEDKSVKSSKAKKPSTRTKQKKLVVEPDIVVAEVQEVQITAESVKPKKERKRKSKTSCILDELTDILINNETTTDTSSSLISPIEPEVVIVEEPVVVVEEPIVVVEEPVVVVEEPIVVVEEPVVVVEEPIVVVEEPIVVVEEPIVVVEEPIVVVEEHVVVVEEPVVIKKPTENPSLDDVEPYDENEETYYYNSKTGFIYEMTKNEDIGVCLGILENGKISFF